MSDSFGRHPGIYVRAIRKRRGLSQEELAHLARIDTSYLGQIERLQRSPTVNVLAKIAGALEVDQAFLLSDNPPGACLDLEDQNLDIPTRIAQELKKQSRELQIMYYRLLKLLQEYR